jgi:hypothetical protein
MKHPLKFWLGAMTVFLLTLGPSVVPLEGSVGPATAAPAGSGLCQQTVDDSTNVVVSVDGTHCVVEFRRVGTTTWTVPAGVTSVSYLVAAGGGGGGSTFSGFGEAAGGGGAGGLLTSSSHSVTPNAQSTIVVGGGGAAGQSSYNGGPDVNPSNGQN